VDFGYGNSSKNTQANGGSREGPGEPAPPPPPPPYFGEEKIAEGRKAGRASISELPFTSASKRIFDRNHS